MRATLLSVVIGLLACTIPATAQTHTGLYVQDMGSPFHARLEEGWRERTTQLGDLPAAADVWGPARGAADYVERHPDLAVLVAAVDEPQEVVLAVTAFPNPPRMVLALQSSPLDGVATVGTDLAMAGGLIGEFACGAYEGDGTLLPIASRRDAPELVARIDGLRTGLSRCGLSLADVIWLDALGGPIEAPPGTRAVVAVDFWALEQALGAARASAIETLCILCPPWVSFAADGMGGRLGPVRAMTLEDPYYLGIAAASLAHRYAQGATDGLNVLVPPLLAGRSSVLVAPAISIDGDTVSRPPFQCFGGDSCTIPTCLQTMDGGQDGGGQCPPN